MADPIDLGVHQRKLNAILREKKNQRAESDSELNRSSYQINRDNFPIAENSDDWNSQIGRELSLQEEEEEEEEEENLVGEPEDAEPVLF